MGISTGRLMGTVALGAMMIAAIAHANNKPSPRPAPHPVAMPHPAAAPHSSFGGGARAPTPSFGGARTSGQFGTQHSTGGAQGYGARTQGGSPARAGGSAYPGHAGAGAQHAGSSSFGQTHGGGGTAAIHSRNAGNGPATAGHGVAEGGGLARPGAGKTPGEASAKGPETRGSQARGPEARGPETHGGETSHLSRAVSAGGRAGHAALSVVRTHGGKLAIGGAALVGGALLHHEDRAFLHADVRPGGVRDHFAVDHDRAFIHDHMHDFPGRDVRRFDARDLGRWRGGLWRNEWHYGRRGWWWDTDGVWYPYDNPIWPYPLAVADLIAYDTAIADGPDEDPAEAGPSGVDIAPLPAPPPGWYRCGTPNGYFPSVDGCTADWMLVPDAPPPN